ncbi:MAG: hypothetical protein GF417_10860 [Candidatus Latescibacteria bacterium]|nr:hypothetical protein [bacterium]MBD3424926.1 hypothetical protein [Candidatus Latescibacterota bacterium]
MRYSGRSSPPYGRSIQLALTILIILSPMAGAVNFSDVTWRSLETEHFKIHYHDGEEFSARQVALIAESIYQPVTEFYDYRIPEVHINLMDISDEPGGAAYYYQDRINLDVADYEFNLRGTTSWLRNVTTHEFVHLVSMQKSMKFPKSIPSFYLQFINFERERRPDVITGYPNYEIYIPIAGTVMPNWFAEGMAQFQTDKTRSDIWDSHRDMILRTAAIEGTLLSMDEMKVFGKNSLNAELLYNQGFSMTRFIAEEYGRDRIRELAVALSRSYRIGFDGACREVLGISEDRLYQLWKSDITSGYRIREKEIKKDRTEGKVIAGQGFLNLYPVPDGTGGIYYLSNRGGDYSDMDLVHRDSGGGITVIAEGITSRFTLSPDRRSLCYSRISTDNPENRDYNSLFIYNTEKRRESKIPNTVRGSNPDYSPDGEFITAVFTSGCTDHVEIINHSNGQRQKLLEPEMGTQFYGLSWGEKGILASRFDCTSRDIILIDPGSGESRELLCCGADERDPVWDSSGRSFFYSTDLSGVFNIYTMDMDSGESKRVTNVLGGAFAPRNEEGTIYYHSYQSGGYKISALDNWEKRCKSREECGADSALIDMRLSNYSDQSFCDNPLLSEKISRAIAENRELDRKYGVEYTDIYFFPMLMIYDNKPRLGLTIQLGDILDRQQFLAGGSINSEREFDAVASLEIETGENLPSVMFGFQYFRKYYDYYNRELSALIAERFDLWQGSLMLSYELGKTDYYNRNELIFMADHGEYYVNLNAWAVAEREIGWKYYVGNELSLAYAYRSVRSGVDAGINPRRGREIYLEAKKAYNELYSGELEYFYKESEENFYGEYHFSYEEFIPVPIMDSALSLYLKAGALDRSTVDEFFNIYTGGRDGLRGYSYYSIGGQRTAMARLTYRFPLIRNINRKVLFTYFRSVYAGIFAEAGNGWYRDDFSTGDLKRDVGLEIRFNGYNFNNYPVAATFMAAYGLDDVVYSNPDPLTDQETYYEGNNFRFYGTVAYSF